MEEASSFDDISGQPHSQRICFDFERPSTKYKRIAPPSRITLQRASTAPSPTLPRHQSPRTWKCLRTERFPLRSTVTGSARAGKAGELVAKDGCRYMGDVLAGRPHGHGQFFGTKGDGYYVEYEGEYAYGVRSGFGVRNYFNGEKYFGEWSCNVRCGKGKMEYSNGDVYDGQWKNDKRHGVGSYYCKNGDVFVGTYLKDKREGMGTFYMISRNKKYVAEYTDDGPKCGTVLEIEDGDLCPLEGFLSKMVETQRLKQSDNGDAPKDLPALDLRQPYAVVAKEIEEVRKARARDASTTKSIQDFGGTMGHVELELLRHSFTKLVGGDSLDAKMIPHQLQDLCQLVGLDPADARTQLLIRKLLAERNRNGLIEYEGFLRVVCHFRGMELGTVDFENFDSSDTFEEEGVDAWTEECVGEQLLC